MAEKKRRGLGRGLDSLIPAQEPPQEVKKEKKPARESKKEEVKTADPGAKSLDNLFTVRLSKVEPNRSQPRKNFAEEQLNELADSIKKNGLLEPIVVTDEGNHYEIVAGERRWRACRIAGLKEVQVIVKHYENEIDKVRDSLIENIQREDLNPIEEANAYKRLIEEFHVKQEDIANQVSKNRSTITNSLRLLKLTEPVQNLVMDGSLSMGHARAIVAIEDPETQVLIAQRVVSQGLSVRETERLVASLEKKPGKKKEVDEALQLIYQDLCNRINTSIGMKVQIQSKGKNGGKMEIEFANQEDLDKLMDRLITGA